MIPRIRAFARSDAALATLSNIARAITRLAATVMVARFGGVNAVALLTLTVAIEAVLISTLNALFASPATVLCPGRRRAIRELIHARAERLQVLSGFAIGGIAAVAGLVSDLGPTLAMALASYLPLAAIYQSRRSTRLAEFRSGRVLIAEVLIGALALLGPFVAHLLDADPIGAFWLAQALAHGLGAAWLPRATPGRAATPRRARIAQGAILQTGRAMVIGSLANSMSTRAHPFLISLILGQSSVGLFGAGNTFGAPIRMMSGALRGVLLPRFARHQRRRDRLVWPWWILPSVLLTIATVTWIASVLAPRAVATLFGDEFGDAGRLVPLCISFAITGMATSIVACVRQAAGESGFVARIRVWSSLASPVLFGIALAASGLRAGLIACILIDAVVLIALCRPASTRRGLARRAGPIAHAQADVAPPPSIPLSCR